MDAMQPDLSSAAAHAGSSRRQGTQASDAAADAGTVRGDSSRAAAAATARAGGSSSGPEFELKLVVDDKERRSEDDYLKMYSNIRQEHMRLQQLPRGTTVSDDVLIDLGVRLDQGHNPSCPGLLLVMQCIRPVVFGPVLV
jgi:hypothetical protein